MLAALAPFLLIGLCAVPWVLLVAPRYGGRLAITAVVTGGPLLVLAVQTLTGVVHLPALATLLVATVGVGLLGLALLVRARLPLPACSLLLPWLAAGLGGIVWLGAVALAFALPGADPLSWAMSGDGANNLQHARNNLLDDGINPGRGITVPLVSALLGVAMSLGRPESGDSALLAHDLVALSTFFALALAIASTLIGMVAASLLPRGRALAAGAASLLGCTWLVAGLPIDSGYLNGPISIALLLLAWLAFLDSERAPIFSLSLQLGVAILVMSTWSPLLVVSLALLIATLMRSWVVVRVLRGRAAIPVVVAIAAILAITAVTLAPAFIGDSSVFATPGHGFPVTVGILGGASVLAVVLAARRRREHPRQFDGVIALVAASIAGTAALLALASGTTDPFGAYYPAKLGWMLSVLLCTVALSLVLAAVSRRVVTIVTIAAAILLASVGPAPVREYNAVLPPLARILGGEVWHDGDHSAAVIIDHVGENAILWDSGEPDEAYINYWLVALGPNQTLSSSAIDGYRELRDTGSFTPPALDQLCLLLPVLGAGGTVYTSSAGSADRVREACNSPETTVAPLGG